MKVWIVWEEGYWYGDPYRSVNRVCDSYEKAVDHIKSIATDKGNESTCNGYRYYGASYKTIDEKERTETECLTVHERESYEVY